MKLTYGRAGFVVVSTLLGATGLSAATFTTGDVFASKVGEVREYNPNGTLQQTLSSGLSGYTTGSAFDSSGTLFVTDFSTSQVVTFANNATNTQGTFGSGLDVPEDVLVDKNGNVWISNLDGPGLKEFSSTGTLITSFATNKRIDWFDLNASETTAYMTDESGTISTWNLTTNTAGANLCTGCGDYALRLLGDGTLLVAADGDGVNRVNLTTGAIVQNYTAGAGAYFALNLDPNGTTFWTGSFSNDNVYEFNIASGALITSFNTGSSGSSLYGLSVFGELTQSGGGGEVPEPGSILLLGTALAGVGFGLRKKIQSKA